MLDATGCRSLRVVEEGTGTPVAGARIVPADALPLLEGSGGDAGDGPDPADLASWARTGKDGRARVVLGPLPPGRWRFTAGPGGGGCTAEFRLRGPGEGVTARCR